MLYKFSDVFSDKKKMLEMDNKGIHPLLLKNNEHQLGELWDFYRNDVPIFFLTGFLGTGKKEVAEYSTNFLSSNVLVLRYTCFETTSLDDILLSFFEEFKKLTTQNIIELPRIKTENFTEKINAYFKTIEKPFLIIFNSFDSIKDEHQKEIVDFVHYLSGFSKIKFLIVSKTFENYYVNEDTKFDRITTHPLEKSLFVKYLKENKMKFANSALEELYKQSRGYFYYTSLVIKILQEKEISLNTFITQFQESFKSFYEFLEKEAIAHVPPTARDVFWTLSMFRHGVSFDLLKILKLYDKEKIDSLINNYILVYENSLLYVSEYYREQVKIVIPQNISLKYHRNIVNLYESQLPLKPSERNIMVSRHTMREEIDFHSVFLPRAQSTSEKFENGVALEKLTYTPRAKGLTFAPSFPAKDSEKTVKDNDNVKTSSAQNSKSDKSTENVEIEKKDSSPKFNDIEVELKQISSDVKGKVTAEVKLNDLPFELTEEEIKMLDEHTADMEEAPIVNQIALDKLVKEEELPQIKLSLEDIMTLASEKELEYDYKGAILLYSKALECTEDEEYYNYLPVIYTKMAYANQKIGDWDKALELSMKAKDFYENISDVVKANYIKLSIANIHCETYKLLKARTLLHEILESPNNPKILVAKTYLCLANLEDSLSNVDEAYKCYQKALEFSSDTFDSEILSELYFKYALVSDDKGMSQQAIDYYEKCIEVENNPKVNKFLSSAYSNLATLYLEKNNISTTVKNYLKAYEIDEATSNFDGLYFSSSKLAQVLQKKYPEKALAYYAKALECANNLNDIFYMASASLAIGDFFYNKKEDAEALKQYLSARQLVEGEFSKDNLDKVNMRINDIRFRIGEERFQELESEIIEKNKVLENKNESKT